MNSSRVSSRKLPRLRAGRSFLEAGNVINATLYRLTDSILAGTLAKSSMAQACGRVRQPDDSAQIRFHPFGTYCGLAESGDISVVAESIGPGHTARVLCFDWATKNSSTLCNP